MKALVQRWGNSLALRIPKAFAAEISVREGDEVEMTVTRGRLTVARRPPTEYRLDDLLAQIRPDNVHKEVVIDRTGREVW